MKKSKKSLVQTIIFMIVLAGIIFCCFFLFRQRAEKRAEEKAEQSLEKSEVDKILFMDIEGTYPQTPRAVLKLYSRILTCLHNEEVVPVEIEGLAEKLRLLFDQEFLDNNPFDDHVDSLTAEVAEYDMLKRTINAYTIESPISVVEWTIEGVDYSRLIACYTLKEGKAYSKVYEEFLFRKDDAAKWKIVGWRKVDESEMEK